MESSSLKNGNGRGRRYKEEERVVPTSPSRPLSVPRSVARAPKCPRWFSPRENRRKRATWHISENWRLSHRQALTAKQWPNFPSTAWRCPSAAKRWPVVAPGWRMSGAWRWRYLPPGAVFVSLGTSCWYFCTSPCCSGLLICLDSWNKACNL